MQSQDCANCQIAWNMNVSNYSALELHHNFTRSLFDKVFKALDFYYLTSERYSTGPETG